jgi:hypothetical protein
VQAVKALPSRLQANVLPASVDVKLKLALVLVVVAGGEDVIVVSGGVVSRALIVQV